MSNTAKNLANKVTGSGSTGSSTNEPTFNILPHPAKTNDPADLQPSGGLRHGGAFDAFNNPGPFIPSEDMKKGFPEPLSSEELKIQQAKLNQGK